MQKAIISVLIQIGFYFMTTAANGYVSLQLYDYYNEKSEDYNGGCCDSVRFFGCHNECDNFFEIWLKPYPASWSATTWKSWDTYVLGDDNFDFPGYGRLVGSGLRNPLTYRFSGRWPRSFGIILKVWDDDSGNFLGKGKKNDLVDQSLYNIVNIDAKKNSSSPVTYSISGRRSTTRVLVSVYCDTHYYGTDCGVLCIPRDDNSNGHYTCDQNNGNKICRQGWMGSNCTTDIDECQPNKCYNNATCVDGINSYSCKCSTGYTGRYCGERIDHCARGNQPCDNGGRCVNELDYYRCLCTKGYNGTKCEITPCDSGPCLHNGTCYQSNQNEMGGSFYNCSCMNNFKGKNCEIRKLQNLSNVEATKDSSRTNGSRTSAYFIIGGSVAGTILITIIVALIIWKIKKVPSVATVTQIEIGITNQQSNPSNVSENPALETMS